MAEMPCGHHESLLVKSVESDYQFCELCEARHRQRDAETMERWLKKRCDVLEERLRLPLVIHFDTRVVHHLGATCGRATCGRCTPEAPDAP